MDVISLQPRLPNRKGDMRYGDDFSLDVVHVDSKNRVDCMTICEIREVRRRSCQDFHFDPDIGSLASELGQYSLDGRWASH